MSTQNKIYELDKLIQRVDKWKNSGQKVVLTNGCFDILHLGHIDYLEKARSLGDKLLVAVNSDDSVKRLKGINRPINDQVSRMRILAALQFVDGVVSFNEDTPLKLIEEILPDILVKGRDYKIGNIVGADIVLQNGGKVKTIDLVKGYSTTNIIKKLIKQ
ncbi:MAG: rfaE bifunctional protein nucleotidyltransferase chain/domain [Cyclobacteriaceae bacterium]|jgi:rfaE bifunctional protein nucleotidyltransferase chain/domain